MKSPIFLFSLPRSGSTLMQRVLMSHEQISSVSEPWILLPQIYLLKNTGSLSEYSFSSAHKGIKNFIDHLPLKEDDYYSELGNFILNLYSKQCKNNESYFLDKTPRYYLIIDEIFKLFPDAKCIFLFRSPEKILSSMMQTWGDNGFKSFLGSYYDLVNGFALLSKGFDKHNKSAIKVNYEDFVTHPKVEIARMIKYLDLDPDETMIHSFNFQTVKGDLGDPTGVKKYKTISQEGLNKWKSNFNTRYRKKIASSIIKKISEESIQTQGYNKSEILSDIKSLKTSYNLIRDIKDFIYYQISRVTRKYKLHLFYYKNYKWFKSKNMM